MQKEELEKQILTDKQLKALIRRPELILKLAYENNHDENFWFQVFRYLELKRMDGEMYDDWKRSQDVHGYYKYAAVGQLFARYATLRKGFKPLKKSSFDKK